MTWLLASLAAQKKASREKIKVGHAGTLDPLATASWFCVPENTLRKSRVLLQTIKYILGLFFLENNSSYDLETAYDAELPTEHISTDMIDEVRQSFCKQLQTPQFSAKQIDGKRYEFARAGEAVELKQMR